MDIQAELQHFSTILTGCESINSVMANGGKLSYEGRYAQTVLRLHAEDAGLVAGTEGFLDSIKKGAQNTKQWIMKILAAIKEWSTKVLAKMISAIKRTGRDQNFEVNEEASITILTSLKSVLRFYKDVEKNVYDNDTILTKSDVSSMISKVEIVIKELDKDGNKSSKVIWPNVLAILDRLDEDVKYISRRADMKAAAVPNDLSHPSYNAVSKEAMSLSTACKDLASVTNVFTAAIMRLREKMDKKEQESK